MTLTEAPVGGGVGICAERALQRDTRRLPLSEPRASSRSTRTKSAALTQVTRQQMQHVAIESRNEPADRRGNTCFLEPCNLGTADARFPSFLLNKANVEEVGVSASETVCYRIDDAGSR